MQVKTRGFRPENEKKSSGSDRTPLRLDSADNEQMPDAKNESD